MKIKYFLLALSFLTGGFSFGQTDSGVETMASDDFEIARPNPPRYPGDPVRPGPEPRPPYYPPRDPRYPDPRDPRYPDPRYPDPGRDRFYYGDLCNIDYTVNVNGRRGTLALDYRGGGVLRGYLTLRGESRDRIRGRCSSFGTDRAQISFDRRMDNGRTQHFRGQIYAWGSDIRIQGTFTEGRKSYGWSGSHRW